MSGEGKPLAIQVMERSSARGTARLVLLGYAYYGDRDGTNVRPAPQSAAKRAGVSVRTVERYRPQLIKLGELVVVARDARGEHAEYAVVLGQDRHLGDPGRQNRHHRRQGADSGDIARARGQDPGDPGEDGKPSSPTRRTSEAPRDEVDRLCELLAELVAENGRPVHLIAWPSDGWRRAGRLLLDRDRRDPAEAERLIRWSQLDDFWRANVLGMPTFRKQYDALRLQAARGGRNLALVPASSGRMSKGERVDADVAELLAEAAKGRQP